MNTDKLKAWIEQNKWTPTGQSSKIDADDLLAFISEQDDWIDEQSIYKEALSKWGITAQVDMAQGECAELIAELTRFFTQGKSTKEKVIDEISDVEIMCGQLREIFGSEKVDDRKNQKLNRLKGILSGDIEHPHAPPAQRGDV